MLSFIGRQEINHQGRKRKVCDGIMPARVITLFGYYLRFTTASLLAAYLSEKALPWIGFHLLSCVCSFMTVCGDNAKVTSDLPMLSRADSEKHIWCIQNTRCADLIIFFQGCCMHANNTPLGPTVPRRWKVPWIELLCKGMSDRIV